jgi:hypothetical protein
MWCVISVTLARISGSIAYKSDLVYAMSIAVDVENKSLAYSRFELLE